MTKHPFWCHIAVTPSFLHHHSTPSSKICCHITITLLSHYYHRSHFFSKNQLLPPKNQLIPSKTPRIFSKKSLVFQKKWDIIEESAHLGCAALWQMWQKKTQNSWYIRAHARDRTRTPSASTASPNLLPPTLPNSISKNIHQRRNTHRQWNNQRRINNEIINDKRFIDIWSDLVIKRIVWLCSLCCSFCEGLSPITGWTRKNSTTKSNTNNESRLNTKYKTHLRHLCTHFENRKEQNTIYKKEKTACLCRLFSLWRYFYPYTNRGGGRKRYQKVVRFQKERTKENRQSVQKDGGLLIGF